MERQTSSGNGGTGSQSDAVDPADVAFAIDEARRRKRRRLLIVVALAISLVGYVLNPALFVFLERRGMLPPAIKAVWIVLLWPLEMAYKNSLIVRDFYDGYFALIGVDP